MIAAFRLSFDPATRRLSHARGAIVLEVPAARIVAILLENAGAPVQRQTLLAVLGEGADAPAADEQLDRALAAVRAVLNALTHERVKLIEGDGVRLSAPQPTARREPARRPTKRQAHALRRSGPAPFPPYRGAA